MSFFQKRISFLFVLGALLLFFMPLFFGKTLTNFSDAFAVAPWSANTPDGWFHSNAIDASPVYFFNPSDILSRELLRDGQAFTWNPYVGFGTPWLGVMQSAPYFPGKLLSMFWPDYWRGQDLMLIGLLLTACTGTYLLLRSMGATREAATFSALAYMLCQRLFLVINMPSFAIECLLPLMLYSINETVKRKSVGFSLLAGFIGGAQFLAGFPEASFILGLVSGLFFLWLLFQERGSAAAVKHSVLLGVVIAAVTLLLSAFQLLEFGKLLASSKTAHSAIYGTVVKEPFWLLAMLLPNFFGMPFQANWTAAVSPYDHMPLSMFCGISTVILAFSSLMWRSTPSRHFILFFAVLFLVFAGYDHGFPFLKFIGYLPFINLMSTAWNVFVIPFSLSVLAGFGMQSLRHPGALGRLSTAILVYLMFVIGLLLIGSGAALTPPLSSFVPLLYVVPFFLVAVFVFRLLPHRNAGAGLLFSLVIFESYMCVRAFGYLHYYGPPPPPPPSLTWLSQNVGHERIFGADGIFPANMLIQNRIRDVRHLDAMYSELYVEYVAAIWDGARSNVYHIGNPEWKSISDPLLDMAAIKYVVVPQQLQSAPAGYSQDYSDSSATIYRNGNAFARAHFVSRILKKSAPVTPEVLKAKIQELRNGVFLDDYPTPTVFEAVCPSSSEPTVEFLQDDVTELRLRVNAPCAGFIVLADLFYSGWTAEVNGKQTPIFKANGAFRAVEVSAGQSEILMNYKPASWRFGMPIALMTFSGIVIFQIARLVRLRRSRSKALV